MNTIGFDVDGTLITYDDKPRHEIIDLFRHFEKLKCHITVASGGGADYARHWCDKLGLNPQEICSKRDLSHAIDVWFDDEAVNIGKVNIKV